MAGQRQKRTLWDDLADAAREVAETLGRVLNPRREPERAPVPIPVRANPPYPRRRPDPRN
ncbi:MAG: hypothetical protein MUC99_04290 [Anaerolineae bacterium]|jgi:hypothetical protein|nr:hypothetical protein [Anaerolineae bacterium]